MDDAVGLVLLGLPLVYAGAQALMIRRTDGGWRVAAGLPLVPWALWALWLAFDLLRDPTSHNLFPFEILIGSSLSLLYLGGVAVARGLAGR